MNQSSQNVNDFYFEVSPPADQADFVQCYWYGSKAAKDGSHAILPDGCVDFVVSVSEFDHRSYLFGTTTKATPFPTSAGYDYIGVKFQPGAHHRCFNIDGLALTDTYITPPKNRSIDASRISETLNRLEHPLQKLAHLSKSIGKASRLSQSRIDRTSEAVREIIALDGAIYIKDLVSRLGVCRRSLEREFINKIGVSPKVFARIIRFNKAKKLIESGTSNFVDTAAMAGYSDQAHMIREFKTLTATTPSQFAKS